MQQVLSSTSKVLIDQKGGGNLLMLPLDKLLQMSGAGAGAEAAGSAKPSTVPEPAAEAGARSRDAFRSRERETRP